MEGDSMRQFCAELENENGAHHDQLSKYHSLVYALAEWHKENYTNYSEMLKTDLGFHLMNTGLSDATESLVFSENLTYTFGAKLAYFSVSDTLVKLILSCFSYGPSRSFLATHGITGVQGGSNPWLRDKSNEVCMTEILAKVLRDEHIPFDFDLAALLQDRSERNGMAHASERAACLSAMRVYNSIRSMLIFLDDSYTSRLHAFTFDTDLDYDSFLAEPCGFNFDDYTTILLADSVHDVRKDYRQAVANLAWDLVIDYDGYSDCGGLMSTVEHNRIQKDVLSYPVACGPQILSRGSTLWYRCGEYQTPSYIPESNGQSTLRISAYNYFHKDPSHVAHPFRMRNILNNTKDIFKKMLQKANRLDRALNIVAVINDQQIVKQIIDACNDLNLDDYFLTWVGLCDMDEKELCRSWFNSDLEDMNQHFRYFPCPTSRFYDVIAEHKTTLRSRASLNTTFSIPGKDGPVPLSENDRTNLAPYFDILYDGCEQADAERSKEMQTEFYRGNRASWNVIANNYAVNLKKPSDYDNILQRVRLTLGITQQKPQQRLLFIKHKAGLGGSTLVRQIGWSLHKDFAVLAAKYYEPNRVTALIENLYDNVLQTAPIIILADDTLPSLQSLCDDICRTNRRCILIISCRERNNILQAYPDAQSIPFLALQDAVISPLQSRFREQSSLSPELLAKRDREFSSVFTNEMYTPFIIGLYYLEEKFNINSYVQKALDGCFERRYADVVACLALYDQYNCKAVPISFVKSALGLRQRENFFKLVPDASTIICQSDADEDIPTYHFQHSLLSQRYLQIYCQKYYHSDDQRDMLYDLAYKIIDFTADMVCNNLLQEFHIDILIIILIQNKTDINTENLSLSTLLRNVGMRERQRQLLQHLADAFQPYADRILANLDNDSIYTTQRVDRLILRLTSHAHAHLGRMYSRLEQNYKMAEEHFEQAINYRPDEDPNIYHMAATSLIDKLKQQWNQDQSLGVEEIKTKFPLYEMDIQRAADWFDCACDYGSPDYGYPSKLELLYSYLLFVYRVMGIRTTDDLSKLSSAQTRIRLDFVETLEEAKSFDALDNTAIRRICEYRDKFDSQIMFGNYSKAIEFYQNRVDQYHNGSSGISEWESSLKGLIYARINWARDKAQRDEDGDRSIFRHIANAEQLLKNISEILDQPRNEYHYSDYMTRSTMYYYWMQVAKITGCSLEDAVIRAKQWLEMEESYQQRKNPEPYYYLRSLYYLEAREGSQQALVEAKRLDQEIDRMSSSDYFSRRRRNIELIRDILVEGKGMAQMFDVSYCQTEDEMMRVLAKAGAHPIVLQGHFNRILNRSNALIAVHTPVCWLDMEVRFEIGKGVQNTLTDRQQGHNVMFYAGFSIHRAVAISNELKDISVGEKFVAPDKLAQLSKSLQQKSDKKHPANIPPKSTSSGKILATKKSGSKSGCKKRPRKKGKK